MMAQKDGAERQKEAFQLVRRGGRWQRRLILLLILSVVGTVSVRVAGFTDSSAWCWILGLACPVALLLAYRLGRWSDQMYAKLLLERALCPKCQYDLTGNESGVCPECGTEVKA